MKKIHLAVFLAWLSNNCVAQVSEPLATSSLNYSDERKEQNVLSLQRAIYLAQKNDPWLVGNKHQQQALEAMSVVADTLPDPTVSIALANVGISSLDFGQEPMSQMKVSVAQMFPRGDSLAIKQQQLKLQSEQFPFQRYNRRGKVAVTVGLLWLDIYRVQQSIALIERNRSLFEQLADVAQASYSSALGKTRQQDLVRAQLELTRLEDKLFLLQQKQDLYLGQLLPWLDFKGDITQFHSVTLSKNLPQIDNLQVKYMRGDVEVNNMLVKLLQQHPSVSALNKRIEASKKSINLAHQQYKPAWGINASYGYRADDAAGSSRSDLLSLGVSFDLPIFSEKRQDYAVKAAISQTEAVKTEKLLLLRQLISAYHSHQGRLAQLNKRKTLFDKTLLPQIKDQSEASLTAYTNDDGDFAEVVRARIAQLTAQIDQLAINVEQQKIILELNYLFINKSTPMSFAVSGIK